MKCTALKKEKVMIISTLFLCSAIIFISYFLKDKYNINIYHLMSNPTKFKHRFDFLTYYFVSVVISPFFVLILIKNAKKEMCLKTSS